MHLRRSLLTLSILALCAPLQAQVYSPEEEGTFSILGRDPNTG